MTTTKERLKALVEAAIAVREDPEAAAFIAAAGDAAGTFAQVTGLRDMNAEAIQSVAVSALAHCYAKEMLARPKPTRTDRFLKLVAP